MECGNEFREIREKCWGNGEMAWRRWEKQRKWERGNPMEEATERERAREREFFFFLYIYLSSLFLSIWSLSLFWFSYLKIFEPEESVFCVAAQREENVRWHWQLPNQFAISLFPDQNYNKNGFFKNK